MVLRRLHVLLILTGLSTHLAWASRLSWLTRSSLASTNNNVLSFVQILIIVSEMVELLGVNDGFNELKSGVSLLG